MADIPRTAADRALDDQLAVADGLDIVATERVNGKVTTTPTGRLRRRTFATPADRAAALADFRAMIADGVSREKAFRLCLSDEPGVAEQLAGWKQRTGR